MLAGGTYRSATDPYATSGTPFTEAPHWIILWPFDPETTGMPTQSLTYNLLQRLTYLLVIFVLFPLMFWTGLAMSPAVRSVFPAIVMVFGGQQSARTIHFFAACFLILFLVIHIVMVCLAGFTVRVRAMITGHIAATKERI